MNIESISQLGSGILKLVVDGEITIRHSSYSQNLTGRYFYGIELVGAIMFLDMVYCP